ncbi:alpha/beta hydrolase [Roseibium aestuarii]|uniref:Alpha/beta hydrolase n=1 Tax=Roseibium aestuarii TaxID=2600299 RepID=A0ABW4JXA9_9HYPH|nr:alpha/beta hydrolase [Roseibium aestuarii]
MTDLELYATRVRQPDPQAPMILALHGTGGDENQFFDLVRQIHPGAGILSPRGDVSEHGAARFFRRTGEGVYDMPDLARATQKMAAFIRAHRAAHEGAPFYAFGYSNGANILANVLLHHGDLVDRAALLHPLIPFDPPKGNRYENLKLLITAGQMDPICPLPLTQSLIDHFRAGGAAPEVVTHRGGHEIRQEELVALQRFLTS